MSEKKLTPANEIVDEALDAVAGGADNQMPKIEFTPALCPHCHAQLPFSMNHLPAGFCIGGFCPTCKQQYTLGSMSL